MEFSTESSRPTASAIAFSAATRFAALRCLRCNRITNDSTVLATCLRQVFEGYQSFPCALIMQNVVDDAARFPFVAWPARNLSALFVPALRQIPAKASLQIPFYRSVHHA